MERILKGYNIFKAAPLRYDDPGYTDSSVFRPNWNKNRMTTTATKYYYPKEYTVNYGITCNEKFHVNTINDESDLQKSYTNNIHVGGGG